MAAPFKNLSVVPRIVFGRGTFDRLPEILADGPANDGPLVFLVDDVFHDRPLAQRIPLRDKDRLLWVSVEQEPTTAQVDELTEQIGKESGQTATGVIGIGGGSVMDLAKAVSLMLTNEGSAADYQGWDLIRNRATYHAGIPTLSGTGAEVSRTTVLSGPVRKLGINSDYTIFDQIVLDPDLIRDAPDPQRFYTGMDCYLHCVEALTGTYLNEFSRTYGEKAVELCREVFLGDPGDDSDEKLMMASYCGGMSIAYSQVGACHALSYGLSYVLGLRHGQSNCVVFDQLEEFYADGVTEFRRMADKQRIDLPRGVTRDCTDQQMDRMVDVALSLDPLWENCLGSDWKSQMTRERARELYSRM
jgi:3-deoxy-alpha-D-manno-octulosonate 8-oxidase